MKTPIFALILVLIFVGATATAADNYLIILPNNGPQTQNALKGFPGNFWGAASDMVYLAGGPNEIDWLNHYHFNYQAVPFDDETSTLYLCYLKSGNEITSPIDIVTSGPGYVISKRPIAGAEFNRRLTLRAMPGDTPGLPNDIIMTYSRRIDTLINRVNQDTIFSFLNKLSGNTTIQINGGIDTIHTRYSYAADNRLAAQYLKETLERYRCQVEYHGFYSGNPRHVAAYGRNRAWLVTEGSDALRTTDGGTTWITMPDNTANALWGVDNAGPDSVWITGNIGTIKFSSNGGADFSTQIAGTNGYLFGLDFIDNLNGWVAADTGKVLHTTDGGLDWIRQTTPVTSRLYDICFIDSAYGWAVGRDGAIVHTTNGGQNWTMQFSNTMQRLYGVAFTNRNVGWIAGWAGTLLHTTDGGANWMPVNLWSDINMYHVAFTDSLHGCVDGWSGKIYLTSDAGATWTEINGRSGRNLYGLTFSDSLTGYAVGDGVIEKTTDGGNNWINQTGGIETAWRNVIATRPGTTDPGQQVIICAHFDDTSELPSNRAPGSDDNGSGVTAVVEAARVLSRAELKKTVKFCLWSGEEQGLLGSAAYAADAAMRGDTIVGVFNFDMIAWDGNADGSIELHCGTMPSSLVLGNLFQDVNTDYGINLAPELLTWNSTDRSDHASFWDNNYPAMLGIEDFSSDFNPYYHTTNDNMTHIDTTMFKKYIKASVGSVATLAIIDSVAESVADNGEIPAAFKLLQNYPNPFNASTVISFSLLNKSDIELTIYDLLGRKVVTLASGPMEAGAHVITWNAGRYASGVYLCRLKSGDHSATTRMMLMK